MEDNDVSAGTPGDRSRRRLFYAIAILLPVLFLLLLEGGLRLAGFAAPERLFVTVENAPGEYLQPNERVIQRFFAHPALAPRVSIDTTFFPSPKPPGTFRIVLQGGSTAAGFPYGKWASPAGMLKQRLVRTFPTQDIELISTAMSAVNSYTLADFADEIVAIEPDAVLIYAGHNEYLGVLGVGSAFSSARSPRITRLVLAFSEWRLFRLVQRVYLQLSGALDESRQRPPATLMARIAAERAIPFGSPEFDAGIEQFRHNMAILLDTYRSAGIPVMIATVASNLRDQPPFASALAASTDTEQWSALDQRGRDELNRGDLAAATATARELVDLDDGAASAHFLLARALEAAGETDAARSRYAEAKDRDQLRFRAPQAINTVIRELAAEYGAILIDIEARLNRESEHRIVGRDLMVEHLHPNVEGYFHLSGAFYEAIREQGWIGTWSDPIGDDEAWLTRPVTEIDRLGGEYRVMRLLNDWPFRETRLERPLPAPANEIEVIAQNWFLGQLAWPDAMNQALAYYQRSGQLDEAVRVALNLADAFVFLPGAQSVAGRLLLRQGDPTLALKYLHAAAMFAPGSPEHLMPLAQAFFQAGHRQQSIDTLQRLVAMEPDNQQAAALIDRLESGLDPVPPGGDQTP